MTIYRIIYSGFCIPTPQQDRFGRRYETHWCSQLRLRILWNSKRQNEQIAPECKVSFLIVDSNDNETPATELLLARAKGGYCILPGMTRTSILLTSA